MKNDEASKPQEKESNSAGESEGGSGTGESQSSSENKYQYFEALSPIVCCVDGKFVGKLENRKLEHQV